MRADVSSSDRQAARPETRRAARVGTEQRVAEAATPAQVVRIRGSPGRAPRTTTDRRSPSAAGPGTSPLPRELPAATRRRARDAERSGRGAWKPAAPVRRAPARAPEAPPSPVEHQRDRGHAGRGERLGVERRQRLAQRLCEHVVGSARVESGCRQQPIDEHHPAHRDRAGRSARRSCRHGRDRRGAAARACSAGPAGQLEPRSSRSIPRRLRASVRRTRGDVSSRARQLSRADDGRAAAPQSSHSSAARRRRPRSTAARAHAKHRGDDEDAGDRRDPAAARRRRRAPWRRPGSLRRTAAAPTTRDAEERRSSSAFTVGRPG